jgi:hypothetical protein
MAFSGLLNFLECEVSRRLECQNCTCAQHINQIQLFVQQRVKQVKGLQPLYFAHDYDLSHNRSLPQRYERKLEWDQLTRHKANVPVEQVTQVLSPELHEPLEIPSKLSDVTHSNILPYKKRKSQESVVKIQPYVARFAQSTISSSQKKGLKQEDEQEQQESHIQHNQEKQKQRIPFFKRGQDHKKLPSIEDIPEEADEETTQWEQDVACSEASFDSTLRSQTLEDMFKDAASVGRFSNASSISFVSNSSLKTTSTTKNSAAAGSKTNSLFKRLLELKQQSTKSRRVHEAESNSRHGNTRKPHVAGPLISSSGINLPQVPHHRAKPTSSMNPYDQQTLKHQQNNHNKDQDLSGYLRKDSDVDDDQSDSASVDTADDPNILRNIRKNKLVAPWAKSHVLKKALLRQKAMQVDPDKIFGSAPSTENASIQRLPDTWEREIFSTK